MHSGRGRSQCVVALTPASSSETSLALCYGGGEHPRISTLH